MIRFELIGKQAKVVESKNRKNIGIGGKIIDETKETITILGGKEKKMLLKQNIIIELKMSGKKIKIRCGEIRKRPEDRIKW